MMTRIRAGFVLGLVLSFLLPAPTGLAQEKTPSAPSKGLRVYTCGHSFHVWVPGIVADICKSAGIKDHAQMGLSSIGGSKVIQHWDKANDQSAITVTDALKTGKIDVLTLSPIYFPDAGIEKFTNLALEHNKDIRIVIQPIWLRWDIYEPTTKVPAKVDNDAISIEELRKRHAVYFKDMDEFIIGMNKKLGRTVLYEVPAAQAIIALRAKIVEGKAPGLKKQAELFSDALGHGRPPLMALVGYCNYAVIYRKSPVGLGVPGILKQAKLGDNEEKLRAYPNNPWETITAVTSCSYCGCG